MALNRTTFTGRLAADPISEETPNGTAVCKARVAIDRAGNSVDNAGFVNVVSYGKGAEAAAEHLTKGSLIAFDGNIRVSSWKNDEDEYRERVEFVGQIVFLSTKKADSEAGAEESAETEEVPAL